MAHVNSQSGGSTGAGTTVSTSAFSATSGNCIAVAVSTYENTAVVSSVTDTAGNTYTRVRGDTHSFAGSQEIWVAKNITGHASNVVTATFSASVASGRRINVSQFSGRDPSSPVHDSDVGSVTFGTSVTSGSVDGSDGFADAFACVCTSGTPGASDTITNPASYTERTRVTSPAVSEAYTRTNIPTGSQTVAASWSPSGDAIIQVVVLKQEVVVRSVSGDPDMVFGPSGNPAVVGTMQISGSPANKFTLSGELQVEAFKEISGSVAMAFAGAATPVLPQETKVWGVPIHFFRKFRDIVFLGTREFGVFHEETGNVALTLPVTGEFVVVPSLGDLAGDIEVRFNVAGQPEVTFNPAKLISGSPALRFTMAGNPTNILGGDPFGHAAQFIFPLVATEPNWGTNAITVNSALADGVTDVRAQLQAVFDQAFNEGKHVILPPGPSFYRISAPLILRTAIGSPGGSGVRPRIHTTNASTGFTNQGDILILPNGVSNIYIKNLWLTGTYSNGHPGTEDPQGISLGTVSRVTIRRCRIQNIRGDCIGGRESLWTVSSPPGPNHIIIRDCELVNPFRCAIGFIWHASTWNVIDNFIDKDNAVEAGASFVSGIDIEPEVRNGVGGNCSGLEFSYNSFSMNNATVNPGRGADGKCAFRWQVPGNNNPGGNHHLHHNYGNGFGTGFWGEGGGSWGSLNLFLNVLGPNPP